MRWGIPLAIMVPLTFALAEEMVQSLSPVRTASLIDLSADLLGMICFWWLSQRLLQQQLTQREPSNTIGARFPKL